MIIGFCGLAGSGKDTAADFLVKDNFVKVAMADPLKRICMDTFKFTHTQLWGPSAERNKPDKRYYRLPKSKEEIERLFTEWHETDDSEQRQCHEYIGLTWEQWRCWVESGGYLTPRYALQQLGTEWGRTCYPNVWVDYALRVAKVLNMGEKGFTDWGYSPQYGLDQGHHVRQVKGVVISDVRFLNEVQAINRAGGYVYRLLRGEGLLGSAGQHKSEKEMVDIPFHLFQGVIDNRDWELEQLANHMKLLQLTDFKGR